MSDETKQIDDGGPAMPAPVYAPCSCGRQLAVTGHAGGMSLRDYFAAKAMAEMSWRYRKESAESCYSIADAMLAARKAGAK